jgi:DNA gyrase subunit A
LEGLLTALDHLDEAIDIIRRSRTVETARSNLSQRLKLTEVQAQAILDMQLRRLAALERRKIQDEYKEKQALIKQLERLLSKPALMREAIKEELVLVRERYTDSRRTQIVEGGEKSILSATDLLPDENVWVLVSEKGTIARTTSPEMINIPVKPAEPPFALLEANTQDILYLFAANGRAVSLPVYQLPQSRELGEGAHWAELTGVTRRDHLVAALVRPADSPGFLFLTTLAGVVKRVRMEDMPGITGEPFVVINVGDEDSLGWAKLTGGSDEVILATATGQLIRFKEDTVRPMGLPAGGVMGIKLADELDGVVAMDLVQPEGYVWSVTDNGLAKATPLTEYPTQGRYGQGVINVRLPKDASQVVAATICTEKTELFIRTAIGSTRKLRLKDTTVGSRAVKPRSVLKIGQSNQVTGVVQITSRPEAAAEEEENVAQQLALLDEPAKKRKKRRKDRSTAATD